MVSPVADRDIRDQKKRGKHDDPVCLTDVVRNREVPGSEIHQYGSIGICSCCKGHRQVGECGTCESNSLQ